MKRWKGGLLMAHTLAVLAFLYIPMAAIAVYSFNDSRLNAIWQGFTFRDRKSTRLNSSH